MKQIIEKLVKAGFRPMNLDDYCAFAGAPEDSYIRYKGEEIWLFSPNDPNYDWKPVYGYMKNYEDQQPVVLEGEAAVQQIFQMDTK